jgi:hypothetical protein
MSKLKRALETTLPDVTSLGGGSRYVDRDMLVELLRKLENDLNLAYWLRCVLACAILLLLFGITVRYGNQITVLAGAATGMAITLAGALAALKQVVDEMARIDMILTIAAELSLEALTEVIRKVVAAL